MEDIQFEKPGAEMLPAVLEIYTYYVLKTTASFHINPPSLKEMRRLVFFEDPKYQTFLIRCGGALCGYVTLSPHKPREAYAPAAEVSVYLKPQYTGRGIGGRAIRFIEAFAAQSGVHVLIATICGANAPSIRAFEKCGFVKCAHYREVGQKFGQRLDIVACQKIIGRP